MPNYRYVGRVGADLHDLPSMYPSQHVDPDTVISLDHELDPADPRLVGPDAVLVATTDPVTWRPPAGSPVWPRDEWGRPVDDPKAAMTLAEPEQPVAGTAAEELDPPTTFADDVDLDDVDV